MAKGKAGDEKMDEENFEEVKVGISETEKSDENAQGQKRQPDFRVLQPDTDSTGRKTLKNVGAMWKAESKDGKQYYIMKIGELRLLVFPNK
jgi:uncharacterized protein (DUF736 family)